MKREVLYGGLLACGVALMVLSLVLEGHVSDSVGGMFMGAECSLIGFGGSQFCMRHWEKKDPAAMRQAEIEANDERNVGHPAAGPRRYPARCCNGALWQRRGFLLGWGRCFG